MENRPTETPIPDPELYGESISHYKKEAFTMNPAVEALLSELAADTEKVSVTFFPMGMHTHLMSDGLGGWNLQVHSTVQFPWEEEVIISDESNLTTDELVGRMGILAMIADGFVAQQAEAVMGTTDLDAELNALLNGE